MAHATQVPADFVTVFRHRFASLFGRKIGRQRAEQYLGGLLGGRAGRRNVTALAGTVDGATARALGWLLNKSPWQTRPVVEAAQAYVGDTLGTPDGLFTLEIESFVKRGDNAVGVEKQYVHHLSRTQNCQLGVFLAYGSVEASALVDAALYLPRSWTEDRARRQKAGVPDWVSYQPKSALAVELLRQARGTGQLPGGWVTTWHGEGFEPDLAALLEAEGWRYLLPVGQAARFFATLEGSAPRAIAELLGDEADGPVTARWVWAAEGEARVGRWLVGCTDELTGRPVAFISNAPEDTGLEQLTRLVSARWTTARMLAARCAGVSLDVYRVRGWDGWHRHVALALLASAFRACLPAAPLSDQAEADAEADAVPSFPEPVALHPADAAEAEWPAVVLDGRASEDTRSMEPETNREADERGSTSAPSEPVPTVYRLLVDLAESDWRAVRAFQIWLVADEAGTVLASIPSRAEIERQDVGARIEIRFASEQSVEQLLAALDEVPEIVVAELTAETPEAEASLEVVADGAAAIEAKADDAVAAAGGAGALAELDDTEQLLAALEAELAARTSAREAGEMPAFEGVAEVVGNAVNEAAHALEPAHELVAAHHPNGHANGNGGVEQHGGVALSSLEPPAAPPDEAPVRTPAALPMAELQAAADDARTRPVEEQVVILDVGEESYGIPVQRVREIIRVPPITRVPNGPTFLEGVINLRGQVIPVMDLRKHLGIPPGDETRRSRVVVSELGRHLVGLMVDGVSEVVMVAASEIEPPPTLVTGANDGQIRGVARLGDRLVLFLDPDRLLPSR